MQVQLKMSEQSHRSLKYRSVQNGTTMSALVEQMLQGLKMRCLRVHKRLGSGTYVDDSVILRAVLEGDRRGYSEAEIIDLAAVDLFDAETEGIEAVIE